MYGMQPQQGQQSAHGQATSTPSSHSQTSQPPASAHSDISTGPPAQMSHHQRGAANYPDITRYTPNVIHSPAHMALGNSQQSACTPPPQLYSPSFVPFANTHDSPASLPGQSPYYANSTTPPSYTSGAQPSTHYPNPADMTASPYSQTPYRPSQDWATSYTHSANMPNAAPYGAQHGSVATPRSHDVHNGNHAHNSNV